MNRQSRIVLLIIGIALAIGGTYWMWFTNNWSDVYYKYDGNATISPNEALLAVANFNATVIAIDEKITVKVNMDSPSRLNNIPTWVNEQEGYSPSFGKTVLTAILVGVGLLLTACAAGAMVDGR